MAQWDRKQYMNELRDVGIKDLAIHRRLGKMNYSRNVEEFRSADKSETEIISGSRRGYRIC